MPTLIDSITNLEVKDWYLKNKDSKFFLDYIAQSNPKFNFNPSNGLFFYDPTPEEDRKKLTQTVIQAIFPRPVDLHFHPDVNESLVVLDGTGIFLIADNQKDYLSNNIQSRVLDPFQAINFPIGSVHTFSPKYGGFVRIHLVTSPGKLDTSKEVCITPFDELPVWKELYFSK